MKHTKKALGDFFMYMGLLQIRKNLRIHVEWLLEGEEQYKERIRGYSSLTDDLIDLLIEILKYWAEEQGYDTFN